MACATARVGRCNLRNRIMTRGLIVLATVAAMGAATLPAQAGGNGGAVAAGGIGGLAGGGGWAGGLCGRGFAWPRGGAAALRAGAGLCRSAAFALLLDPRRAGLGW